MTRYADLNEKRRQMVDCLIEEYPEIKQTGTVQFKQIVKYWERLKQEQRDTGVQTLGFPLWLTVEKAYKTAARGVYAVPMPPGMEVKDLVLKRTKRADANKKRITPPKLNPKHKDQSVTITEEEFLKELRDAGIEV